MSENRESPKVNPDAKLGLWLANSLLRPFREFDRNFPETSIKAQDAFAQVAQAGQELGARAIETGKDHGKRAAGKVASFIKNRGVDLAAWIATIGILAVRGLYNAIDWMAEKMAKPAIKAYQNWEPKTPVTRALKNSLDIAGNNIAAAYKGYNRFWERFNDYPKSAYGLAFLSAAQATASVTGFYYLHKVEHAISAGHGTALHFLAVPALIAAGKGSNLLTLKPAIKLGKTTKEGYFESDLYKNRHKPFYMRRIDPTVQLAKKHLEDWDILVEKNRGKFKERITSSADFVQTGISSVFRAVTGATRPTKEASGTLSKSQNAANSKPFDTSKLDSSSITDRWEYIIRPSRAERRTASPPKDHYDLTAE